MLDILDAQSMFLFFFHDGVLAGFQKVGAVLRAPLLLLARRALGPPESREDEVAHVDRRGRALLHART